MSWLLELLVDAIREMCSQFIVDMMELITNMFTELLSCNLSLFEELFSVVGSLYKNVIVPTGIAILLMILVWQLFKSMFGGKAGVNAEEPIELICRSAISLFLLAGSKPLVDYILRIAGTPYQWVVGTKVKVASFSGYVSTLEGVTDTLGISSLSISVLMLIMQFVVAWNYFKMLMVIAERYVLLGVFSYTAPLAFATGGSKATNNILASWSKMFGGQVVLVILNAWCMKMFLSGYGNMMASSYGFTKFFAATLCLVGFCKITFKLDSYMASLGVNLGRPAPGMGAAGAMLAASRIISQAARTASGSGGTGDVGGTRTDMGSSDGMTTNFTGPIPMTPNGGNAMDINDMTSDGDFDKESPPGPGNQQNEVSPADKTVFEELGMTTGSSDTAEMDFGSGDHVNGNIDSMSATSETMSGINAMSVKDDAEAFAGAVSESNSEGETLLDVSGGEQDLAIPAASNVSANGFSESGSEHGILGEMGDYPVEEEMSDFDSEMDLESGSIEMTGQESMSYGKTGTAYNSSVSGEVSNAGEGLGSEIMSALQGNGVSSVNQEKGILDEVGTSSVIGFDATPRAGMNYNENSMPTGMESMSENGIQSDGIMDTGEDLDEETDEADFYAKSAMGILVDTAGNPLKAENTKLSDPGMQNEDDIQPVADETGMAADGFMNVSGSIPTGDISLKPEKSDNVNVNLSYNQTFNRHSVYVEGGLVYRNTQDYIQRSLTDLSGGKYGATYVNHGKVLTKGYNLSVRYGFGEWLSIGGNFTQMNVRDNVKTVDSGSSQESLTYGARMPNLPYQFANSDISFYWNNLLQKGNKLTLTYDNLYMHSFPLYSEALGSESDYVVPTQFAHNLTLSYSLQNGRYNFSVECRNFTNEKLYDNFSLQKAGRAFYGKIRVCFGN